MLSACPCTLGWDASADPLVTGYALYYGVAGSATTNRVDVGATNQIVLKKLSANTKYFFYLVSYNAGCLESPPSSVMYYTPPVLSRLKFSAQADGTMNLRFQAPTGAVCRVEYAPTLNPAHWQSLGSLLADTNGCVAATDPLTNRPPTRFYRAVVP
ncbi:MAG TPA: fibronectin type III domain-containing protein [Candidatus Acidoferrum sp.]|nr:fibronectin type III domain-containing protein [Candidatus Acidoferrum sp.]